MGVGKSINHHVSSEIPTIGYLSDKYSSVKVVVVEPDFPFY
jgi:hypothetical protein